MVFMDKHSFDSEEIIKEVKKQSDMGKTMVRMQMSYLRSFKDGYKAMSEDEKITPEMVELTIARLMTMPSNLRIGVLGD